MSLKTIADQKGISLGCGCTPHHLDLSPPTQIIQKAQAAINDNFHWIVPHSAWKFKSMSASPGVYSWVDGDIVRDYAIANNLKVRGHALLWQSDRPPWIASLPTEDQILYLKEWVNLVVTRYESVVETWDVAGEFGYYLQGGKLNYANKDQWTDLDEMEAVIREVFTLVRSLAPTSKLMYWDWGLRSANKWQRIVEFADSIPECDGISKVMRFNDIVREWTAQKGKYNGNDELKAYQGSVQFSEIRIGLRDKKFYFPGIGTREGQARAYKSILKIGYDCGCRTFGFWQIGDALNFDEPGLWDKNFNPKPAYFAVKEWLESLPAI